MSWVHVVVSRLGIGVYDERWFDYRLDLFESITVPSIASQSSPDFHWLLVVGSDMPNAPRARLDRAIAGLDRATIVTVDFKTDLKATVASWVQAYAARRTAERVATSRLDDDDALRTDAMERLHSEIDAFANDSPHHHAVLSFTTGSMWLPTARRGYTRYHDSLGIGLTVVEPAEGCRSIYNWPHRDIKRMLAPRGSRIMGISDDRLWWLYTTHTLASTDRGDETRVKKILDHRHGYHIDDAMLASFGLEAAQIDRFADRPHPATSKSVLRQWSKGMDLERELKSVREQLAQAEGAAAEGLRVRLAELERERRTVGSEIVAEQAKV